MRGGLQFEAKLPRHVFHYKQRHTQGALRYRPCCWLVHIAQFTLFVVAPVRKHHRTGSQWEGRFKSSLVLVEDYLLTFMCYIELYRVRANVVNDPAQYRCSSYRQNGLGQAENASRRTRCICRWKDEEGQLVKYRGLFRSELDGDALADIRLALAQGELLGSERFSEIMCAAVGIRRTQRKPGWPKIKHETE